MEIEGEHDAALVDDYERLLELVDFSTSELSQEEAAALSDLFSPRLFDDLKLFGSLEQSRLEMEADIDLAEWSGFLGDDCRVLPVGKIEELLEARRWWF